MSEMRPKLNKYSENSNFTVTLRVPEDWKDIRFNVKYNHKNSKLKLNKSFDKIQYWFRGFNQSQK